MDDTNAATRAAVQVRLEGPLYQALEGWRRSRPRIPARSEALRELLERALAEQSEADGKASGPFGAALDPKGGVTDGKIKAVSKALDRLRRPGARLVLTYVNDGMAFAWFVWERSYRGHPIVQRISWEDGRDASPILLPHGRPTKGSRPGSQLKRGANRAYVLARLRRDGRTDLIEMVESGALSVRGALAAMTNNDKERS